jgi:hypothetical protein
LHVSLSWMMSSLHAAINSDSARVERWRIKASFESGGLLRDRDGTVREVVREAVGRRKVVRVVGMDFER